MSSGTSAPTRQQTGDGAQQQAQRVAAQAQEKGQEAAAQVNSKLHEQLDQRSTQAAQRIDEHASDLRAVSNSLRQQDKEGPANLADRLAAYAEKAGGYLRDKDSDGLLSDAEDLARRQPWAVGAGALALGFAASRFLKASSSRRYSTRYAEPRQPPARQSPGVAPTAGPAMPSPGSPAPAPAPGFGERPLGSPPAPGDISAV
jgi:hypothetical protein